jgi:stage II sporulation protein D
MSRFIKIGAAFVLTVALLLSNSISQAATVTIPEKVRIGLYYEGSAACSFNISSEAGLQIGYSKDNNFNLLFEQQLNEELVIRKDTYFINNGKSLVEYNPASNTVSTGDKIGPFHIKIGNDYADYVSALQQVDILKQSGISSYPVFNQTWQVWTGFYTDQAATEAVIPTIEAVLGAGSCSMIQPDSSKVVVAKKDGNIISVYNTCTGAFLLKPKQSTGVPVFKINGSRYRGELEVKRLGGSDMTIVNNVPFEQYVYGVVPNEIESYSPAEALKAQAIAARTYALVQMGRHAKWGFDLCPYQHCQVYGGFDSERSSTNKAVEDTAGKLVKYNGRPANTVFFASSGGWTEDVENVWGTASPYLRSVEDKYEPDTSSHYYWTKSITALSIGDKLLKANVDIGDVTGVIVNKYTNPGRILELVVKGTKRDYAYQRETFRNSFGLSSGMYTVASDADVYAMGADKTVLKMQAGNRKVMTADGLKNTSSTGTLVVMGKDGVKKVISSSPTKYTFTGKGWGHGVGMSQEGAKGMAKAGFTYEQILKYYYTGTTVE